MIVVNYNDLEGGYEMANSGNGEVAVYVSKVTGEVVWDAEEFTGDPCEVENIDENDDYIHLPDKYDLDLGKVLVMNFAETVPEQYDEIRNIFSRRGAYGRFRDFLIRNNLLDKWYAFENKEKKEALVAWCKQNDLEVIYPKITYEAG
ncbi:MAG: hypothetical protein ACI9SQ_001583 [Rubritalea sp.]|jgi:hypothetical protein